MNLTESLTKENFFNEMMNTYPKSMGVFCNWIDEYKKAVNWDALFVNGAPGISQIKFHSIPYAMQQGIWIEFVARNLHQYFEQPEYEYCGDLEEDIKKVFFEIEGLIDNEEQ